MFSIKEIGKYKFKLWCNNSKKKNNCRDQPNKVWQKVDRFNADC